MKAANRLIISKAVNDDNSAVIIISNSCYFFFFLLPSLPLTNTHSSHLLSLSRLKASPPPPPLMSFHAQRTSFLFIPYCSSSSSSYQNGSLPESLNSRTQNMTMTSFDAITGEGSIPKPSYKWQKVLLKVSGEALAGDNTQNIDPEGVHAINLGDNGFIVMVS